MSLEEDDEDLRPRRRYENEDNSPTTPRELKGWFSYTIAAEVFAVVGVGLFLPVTLEQLPRAQGVLFSDRTKACISPPAPAASTHGSTLRTRGDGSATQCVVNFLGREVTTTSFAMYTTSVAVLVQAITLICLSSFADHGPYRKRMLLAFGYTGALCSALFIFISPSVYYLAPFLTIIGVTCLGCSFSVVNSFLPLLIAAYPRDVNGHDGTTTGIELDDLTLQPAQWSQAKYRKLDRILEQSAIVSSKAVALGYAAAVSAQIFSIAFLIVFNKVFTSEHDPTLPMRIMLLLVGFWWAALMSPTLLWLRERPGPPLPESTYRSLSMLGSKFIFYTLFSLSSFLATCRRALRLRHVMIFLFAWFLLSDAVATLSGTAVLFARTELHMGTIAVVMLSLTSIASGMVGAFAWPRIAARYGWTPKTVLQLSVVAMELIPLYGLLGFLPFLQRIGVGGIQQAWEIYPVAVVHGLVMGGISSYARSVFAPLIPAGSEAAFFALFAVTDKGSSAVGPAVVGAIVDRAGTIRPVFWFLAVLVLLPSPLLWWLDVAKGREDAELMADEGRKLYMAVHAEEDEATHVAHAR